MYWQTRKQHKAKCEHYGEVDVLLQCVIRQWKHEYILLELSA